TPPPPAPMEMSYQQPAPVAPAMQPSSSVTTTSQQMTAPAATQPLTAMATTTGPEFGTSSHYYPRGWGVEWQQSYQLGARPEISGSTTVGINDVTSQHRTMGYGSSNQPIY